MRHRVLVVAALGLTLAFFAGRAAAAVPPALTYSDQMTSDPVAPTFVHSGICTSGGGVVWDNLFTDMVKKNVGNNYNEMAFDFNECFGGGMIDELRDIPLVFTSFTSAARHDQPSWARTEDPASGGKLESLYSLQYAPKAGSANPQSQKDAATFARANDFFGPFKGNKEDPQYLSTDGVGDAIKLHRNSGVNQNNNTKYRAILFGGSSNNRADFFGNGNSIVRMYNNLNAAGYAANEVLSAFTGGPSAFNLANVGPWINRDTKFSDMANAWKILKANTDADTQIFYWNSWGHGTSKLDAVAKKKFQQANAPKKGLNFGMDFVDPAGATFFTNLQDTHNFWLTNSNDPDNPPTTFPYFDVVSDLNLTGLTVTLNGSLLSSIGSDVEDVLADGTELKYDYRFGLTSSDFAGLMPSSNILNIDYLSGGSPDGDLSFMDAGLTLGDFPNGLSVPEPASIGLLVAALALLRRRIRE